jgi:hypothetical protein
MEDYVKKHVGHPSSIGYWEEAFRNGLNSHSAHSMRCKWKAIVRRKNATPKPMGRLVKVNNTLDRLLKSRANLSYIKKPEVTEMAPEPKQTTLPLHLENATVYEKFKILFQI